jgi:hypothetical protein
VEELRLLQLGQANHQKKGKKEKKQETEAGTCSQEGCWKLHGKELELEKKNDAEKDRSQQQRLRAVQKSSAALQNALSEIAHS